METASNLFSEFPQSDQKTWKEKVIADLRGVNFDEKLVISDWDDFRIDPLFDAENEAEIAYLRRLDGSGTDAAGNRKILNERLVTPENRARIPENSDSLLLDENLDFEDFAINNSCQNLSLQSDSPNRIAHFLDAFGGRNLRIFGKGQSELAGLPENVSFGILSSKTKPSDKICEMLCAAADLAEQAKNQGLNGRQIIDRLFFVQTLGNNYFAEIAGLRALRLLAAELFSMIAEQKIATEDIFIRTETTVFHQSTDSEEQNLLSNTTQAMSAVLGGAQSLLVRPHKTESVLAERIAGNVQAVLSEESYLTEAADPVAGSYFIDRLTDKIAETAWEKFRAVYAG